MAIDPANNLAETELTASVSDTATTLPVADASVFPDADSEGAFNVLVWDGSQNINPSDAPDAEFVRVTSVDTTADELTVQRGQENTTASAKADGSTVTDTWSVKDRDDIETAIDSKSDDPHGNAAHSETFAVDGDAQPPEEHGDTEHDDTVPSQSDVDGKADDPHGNAAHSETFAVDGDPQPPEEHGDTEHDDTVPSQSDVDGKADDPHGSESHSSEVVHEGEDATFGDTTHDSVSTDSVSGDVVSRTEAIDNLEGNLYLEPEGTDPGTVLENDGDIVFIHE